ncbi:MAG: hypothetical protein CMH56_07085 [Myxococcales bacterium]|nr:hypothetical protein [Myxococcales bacterium]|tara:strand:+ start:3268 stop:4440 length:1173 start_codon:yes stop_codon:yes gene_type:complete
MNPRMWCSLMTFLFVWANGTALVHAGEIETKQNQMTVIQAELAQNRKALKDLRNQKKSLLDALGNLDESLSKLEKEKFRTEEMSQQLEADLKRLSTEQVDAEALYNQLKTRVQNRLKGLYVMGQGRTARLLLDAQNHSELAMRRFMLEKMTQDDLSLFQKHDEALKTILRIRREKKDALTSMRATEKALQIQLNLLKEVRGERQKAIDQVLQDRRLARRRAWELRKRYEALAELVASLIQEKALKDMHAMPGLALFKMRKRLNWPVSGEIIRRFGKKKDKKTGATHISKGLHIRAKMGEDVKVFAAGTVVHVGWMRGFGRIIIINHGESVHSLFAHLSDALVMAGDQVPSGAAIGKVGDTESLDGPKLYFELRHRGQAKNPLKLLKTAGS